MASLHGPSAALAGLVLGIFLCPLPDVRLLALGLVLWALAALTLSSRWRVLSLIAVVAVASGYLRADLEYRHLAVDPLAGLDGTRLDVQGTLLEPERPRARGSACRFRLQAEPPVGAPARGTEAAALAAWEGVEVLARWTGNLASGPGQRWRFRGRLTGLPGPRYPRAFDAGAWLGRQGIHHCLVVEQARYLGDTSGWFPRPLAWRVRAWLVANLEAGLPPRARAMVQGIALGEARALPPDVQQAFRSSGTSHLLAASGLNVAVMTGLVFWAGRRLGFGRRPAALPALCAAAFYALLAGSSPSVTRAAVMAGVALSALVLGRTSSPWHSLQLASLFILAVRPLWLMDVGFQLSLVAVAGLAVWSGPLERRLWAWPRPLRLSVAASLAATLATAPVLCWHFQQVSVVAILANLVMVPVAEAMLPVGLAGAVLAGFWEPLARIPFLMCTLGTEFLCACAQVLGDLVQPVRVPRPGWAGLAAWGTAFVWLRMELAGEASPRRRAVLAVLALGLALGALAAPRQTSGDLTLRLAEGPGGVVAWVTTPEGKDLLLVETQEDLERAEELLALQGRRAAHGVFVLSCGPAAPDFPEPGLRVEAGSGTWRLVWRRFSFLWASEQASVDALPEATVAMVARGWSPGPVRSRVRPGLTVWLGGPPRAAWRDGAPAWWSTRRHGPLEVRSDGCRVRWQRWMD